jgi:hypothetical protein
MTTMIAELYDALLAAGSPEDKARKAAEAMAGFDIYEQRFVRVEADIAELKRDVAQLKRDTFLLKWMIGFVLLFQVTIFAKLFLH